jgi:AcrR family transcriptional regulator
LTYLHRSPYVFGVATQADRRADTRRRLLDAAAELFAERGVEATSIDAIAERADRTSGAVYDHFGGKAGLLVALLDGWVGDVGTFVSAELSGAESLDEWLTVLWRNVSAPLVGGGRWIALEHELWSYALRNTDVQDRLARRYRSGWTPLGVSMSRWVPGAEVFAPALIGLLFGLEMMRRIDPSSVTEEVAITALHRLVAGSQTPADQIPADQTPAQRINHAHTHL